MEVKLSFEDKDLGFVLESTLEGEGIDFSGEFGDAIYDLDGHVVYYDYMFRSLNGEGNIFKELENLVEDVALFENQIKGRYTIPELGVENATFKEVLEAVKKYYEEKLTQKQPA